jgi:hypothetical protein
MCVARLRQSTKLDVPGRCLATLHMHPPHSRWRYKEVRWRTIICRQRDVHFAERSSSLIQVNDGSRRKTWKTADVSARAPGSQLGESDGVRPPVFREATYLSRTRHGVLETKIFMCMLFQAKKVWYQDLPTRSNVCNEHCLLMKMAWMSLFFQER